MASDRVSSAPDSDEGDGGKLAFLPRALATMSTLVLKPVLLVEPLWSALMNARAR